MPYTPEFQRAAEIEREIEILLSEIFDREVQGNDAAELQGRLDAASNELAGLKTLALLDVD
ncbi:hypothetical protein [Sphingomonas bacterium]|uniref:hypothetical protein n=1 Tax=Sphingomonas bacterium TaxID=1895847 RepID=UPI001576B22D|nr:hypothetical protein [Sphingomonas bacterium]